MSSSTPIAEIVELVGSSNKSWEDAVQTALNEAVKTIRNITGIEVFRQNCTRRPKNRKYYR